MPGSCLTSEHALNQEHALCTWMWVITSKLAVVVLCLHFTLTHFFCLTTPLSDRWVSIYESLSQPSLNSLPLAYHFDLYQLTLFCFPCFICIFLWREKQREWGWWFQHWLGHRGWLASCPTEAETWWFLYMACCYHDLLWSGREKRGWGEEWRRRSKMKSSRTTGEGRHREGGKRGHRRDWEKEEERGKEKWKISKWKEDFNKKRPQGKGEETDLLAKGEM